MVLSLSSNGWLRGTASFALSNILNNGLMAPRFGVFWFSIIFYNAGVGMGVERGGWQKEGKGKGIGGEGRGGL